MNQGSTENGLRWRADAHSIGFTLTLSEGLSPHELLCRVGAEARHVVPLTRSAACELLLRDEADGISDLDGFLDGEDDAAAAKLTRSGFLPVPPTTIVRAGSVAGWAYALEEFTVTRARTSLRCPSEGGRSVCIATPRGSAASATPAAAMW
ncbi:hypothetical protein ACGH52_37425 [Streptomyces sp. BBFR25]|uniref:hypothetical protein n=1 Tax=Streptomyces sp. BBFR25 TaxID=3372855 RepID=UPI0037DCA9A1